MLRCVCTCAFRLRASLSATCNRARIEQQMTLNHKFPFGIAALSGLLALHC